MISFILSLLDFFLFIKNDERKNNFREIETSRKNIHRNSKNINKSQNWAPKGAKHPFQIMKSNKNEFIVLFVSSSTFFTEKKNILFVLCGYFWFYTVMKLFDVNREKIKLMENFERHWWILENVLAIVIKNRTKCIYLKPHKAYCWNDVGGRDRRVWQNFLFRQYLMTMVIVRLLFGSTHHNNRLSRIDRKSRWHRFTTNLLIPTKKSAVLS